MQRNWYVASIIYPVSPSSSVGGKIYEIARFAGASADDSDSAWASKLMWNRWCAAQVIAISKAVAATVPNSQDNAYAIAM